MHSKGTVYKSIKALQKICMICIGQKTTPVVNLNFILIDIKYFNKIEGKIKLKKQFRPTFLDLTNLV